MLIRPTSRFGIAVLAGAIPAGLLAQTTTTPPYTIRVTQGTTVSTLLDGASVSYTSDFVGQTTAASVVITYRGTATMTINSCR